MDPVEVAYAGVAGQRQLLRSGALTAVELLDVCLDRIDRYDGRIGAFRVLFRDTARAQVNNALQQLEAAEPADDSP